MAEGEKRLSKPPPDLLMPVLGLDNSIRGKILRAAGKRNGVREREPFFVLSFSREMRRSPYLTRTLNERHVTLFGNINRTASFIIGRDVRSLL